MALKTEQTGVSVREGLYHELASAALVEKTRARRWSLFFRFMWLGVFLLLIAVLWMRTQGVDGRIGSGQHTALVSINGVIAANETANVASILEGVERALKHRQTAGLILRINSPGGSPVQSGIVYDELLRLRSTYPDIPMHAVITDVGASGGYYIASAADRIFADKASLVGSIGVRMDSFGFTDAMDELGVERRLLTAGDNKALLDPFLPQNPDHVEHMQAVLNTIHQQFIDAVKRGRGERLSDTPDVFSGLIWSGEQAVSLGLIDELASEYQVARDVFNAPVIVNFTAEPDPFEQLTRRLGASIASPLDRWFARGGALPETTLATPLATPAPQSGAHRTHDLPIPARDERVLSRSGSQPSTGRHDRD